MTKKLRTDKFGKLGRKLSSGELSTICYIATLTLAAIALIVKIDSPVVWTFLGMAIGALFGQANETSDIAKN